MAAFNHLIDKFDASDEIKEVARTLIRQVQLRTGPGSGHELGPLAGGLPAACMQLASERLNNTAVSKAVAQEASCLHKKNYDTVYTVIKTLLEENEGKGLSYQQLQMKYQLPMFDTQLKPYITKVENELIAVLGMDHQSDAFKGAVFFWICSSVQLKVLKDTQTFAHENKLPLKKFVRALTHLNESCPSLRQEIKASLSHKSSPTKVSSDILSTRHSPSKANNDASTSTTTEGVEPARRSLRNALAQDSALRTSPVKRTPHASPTKIVQPTAFRGFALPGARRELPNRDSPKKHGVESKLIQERDGKAGMELDSTTIESPSKKRKLDTTEKLASRPSSPALRQQVRLTNVELNVSTSPAKTNRTNSKTVSNSFPVRNTRKTALHTSKTVEDTVSSSDESVPEISLSTRRHRPVYLDHKQWNTRDARLDRIWKKANKARKKLKLQLDIKIEDDIAMDEQ